MNKLTNNRRITSIEADFKISVNNFLSLLENEFGCKLSQLADEFGVILNANSIDNDITSTHNDDLAESKSNGVAIAESTDSDNETKEIETHNDKDDDENADKANNNSEIVELSDVELDIDLKLELLEEEKKPLMWIEWIYVFCVEILSLADIITDVFILNQLFDKNHVWWFTFSVIFMISPYLVSYTSMGSMLKAKSNGLSLVVMTPLCIVYFFILDITFIIYSVISSMTFLITCCKVDIGDLMESMVFYKVLGISRMELIGYRRLRTLAQLLFETFPSPVANDIEFSYEDTGIDFEQSIRLHTACLILWYTQGTIMDHHCYECEKTWIQHLIEFERISNSNTYGHGHEQDLNMDGEYDYHYQFMYNIYNINLRPDIDKQKVLKEKIGQLLSDYCAESVDIHIQKKNKMVENVLSLQNNGAHLSKTVNGLSAQYLFSSLYLCTLNMKYQQTYGNNVKLDTFCNSVINYYGKKNSTRNKFILKVDNTDFDEDDMNSLDSMVQLSSMIQQDNLSVLLISQDENKWQHSEISVIPSTVNASSTRNEILLPVQQFSKGNGGVEFEKSFTSQTSTKRSFITRISANIPVIGNPESVDELERHLEVDGYLLTPTDVEQPKTKIIHSEYQFNSIYLNQTQEGDMKFNGDDDIDNLNKSKISFSWDLNLRHMLMYDIRDCAFKIVIESNEFESETCHIGYDEKWEYTLYWQDISTINHE